MKTIRELRLSLHLAVNEINHELRNIADKYIVDFDVFLHSKGFNLQREFVWDINQKRELIWSILKNRHIPRISLMNIVTYPKDIEGKYEVIDGKQRLSTMIDFYKNKFTLLIDNKEYLFSDLPVDYQRVIRGYQIPCLVANEDYGMTFNDHDRITWFKYINFAGTPQDKEHLEKFNN